MSKIVKKSNKLDTSKLYWSTIGHLVVDSCLGFFGVIPEEQPKFKLLKTLECNGQKVQIRKYEPTIVASTVFEDDRDGFMTLANYIFGNNSKPNQSEHDNISMTSPVSVETVHDNIAMTAPVSVEAVHDNISMTAPVQVEKQSTRKKKMQFTMPSKYTMETLPKPNDDRITIEQKPAQVAAIITFGGNFSNEEDRDSKRLEIVELAKELNLQLKSDSKPFFLGYNAPFTPGFLRTNETGVYIDWSEND